MNRDLHFPERTPQPLDGVRELDRTCRQCEYRGDDEQHDEPHSDIDAGDNAFRVDLDEAPLDQCRSATREEYMEEERENQYEQQYLQPVEQEEEVDLRGSDEAEHE